MSTETGIIRDYVPMLSYRRNADYSKCIRKCHSHQGFPVVGLTASTWPFRLTVRTLPFHGKNSGSIPLGATMCVEPVEATVGNSDIILFTHSQ